MNIVTSLLRSLGYSKGGRERAFDADWITITGAPSGINEANLLEANKEWVFIAVNKIATSVASIRFKVMRYQGSGDDKEVFKGPLAEFLESPAPNFTGKDFIYLNTVYKELGGNAFWEKLKGNAVRPLVPTRITPVLATDGTLIAIKYSDGGAQRTITAKDYIHDRYIDPAKPWWGAGKLQKIARWVDTSSYVAEFLSRFFVNGATFGGFVETEEESQERIKLIKLGLANDHVGVRNAHKIGVLPKGSKFSKVTANMAEMEMGETDDRYRDKILSAFGVPKTLVGLTTEVNRASAEASEYIFAKYTVKPIADDFVEFLNTTVAPMLDRSGAFYFAYDEFVPVNMEIALKEREIALAKQPYMTVNEVRASVGLPKVAGGDVVYGSPMQVPLGTPPVAPALPADDNDEDEDEPKKFVPARARASMRKDRFFDEVASKALEIATAHHDPDAENHKGFVERVEGHERGIEDAVRAFNDRQERTVMDRLLILTKDTQKGELFDMNGEVSVLVDFVSPLLRGLMIDQAVAEFIGQEFPGELDTRKSTFDVAVAAAAKRLARSYNRTTADLLTKKLAEGIEAGEGLNQLIERVRQVYDYSNQARAAAVARTEAFYIANEGSREAFIQSGVVKTMRWYTADSEACQFCAPENGRTIGVSEVFYEKGTGLVGSAGGRLDLDYRAINVPPLHTNCRCFIRPERIDIG